MINILAIDCVLRYITSRRFLTFFNNGEPVIRKNFDHDNSAERKDSKLLPLLLFGAAFFALLALISYSPEDINFIYGGTSVPPVNWIGPAGA